MAKRRRAGHLGDVDLLTWRPNSEQKKTLKSWLKEEHDWTAMLLDALHTGHKLSAMFYGDGDAYFVTVTCRDDKSLNYNKALSVRHSEPMRALGAILWLMHENGETDWAELALIEDEDW